MVCCGLRHGGGGDKPKLLLQGAKAVEVYLQEDKPVLINVGLASAE